MKRVVVFLMLACITLNAFPKMHYRVSNTEGVRVVYDPSTTIGVGYIKYDKDVTVLKISNGWAQIEFKNNKYPAYVKASDLKPVFTPATEEEAKNAKWYVVTSSTLNVRFDSSADAPALGKLKSGDMIPVISISNGWATVIYNDYHAFVMAKYLKKYVPTQVNNDEYSQDDKSFGTLLFVGNYLGESCLNIDEDDEEEEITKGEYNNIKGKSKYIEKDVISVQIYKNYVYIPSFGSMFEADDRFYDIADPDKYYVYSRSFNSTDEANLYYRHDNNSSYIYHTNYVILVVSKDFEDLIFVYLNDTSDDAGTLCEYTLTNDK